MMGNVATVVGWSGKMNPANAGKNAIENPLAGVPTPKFSKGLTGEKAFTLDEASLVLAAARRENTPARRWLPWLCAYSGARVEELVSLKKSDFLKIEGRWFMHISTGGGQKLKNEFAERHFPLHPSLVGEGLVDFIQECKQGQIFMRSSARAVRSFVRGKVGITRTLSPNHAWRHLFEDLCKRDGVSEAARTYLTGRTSGKSSEQYGRSQALWGGLAAEVDKIKPIIPDPA